MIWPDDVDPRTAIDAEMIDRPMGVVDGFEGAGLGALREHAGSQAAEDCAEADLHND
ncbi:hypothetical protein D3C84_1306840 [compost metagenome]